MTAPVLSTIDTWSERDTSVAAVNAALDRIRRCEQRAAVRAAVMTLVVVTRDTAEAELALDVVYSLGVRHPAHALVLLLEPGPTSRIDSDVRVHCVERGGRAIAFEDVLLHVHGPLVDHLDSLIEPFTLPDLPVVVWLHGISPRLQDPLLGVADRLLVDSDGGMDDDVLAELVLVARRLPVTDLAWVRVTPWRLHLACLLDEDPWRSVLSAVTGVHATGGTGTRRLLAGWIISRLELTSVDVDLANDPLPRLDLLARPDGINMRVAVRPEAQSHALLGTIERDGDLVHQRTRELADGSFHHVVAEALCAERDHVYEAALAAAANLPSPGSSGIS